MIACSTLKFSPPKASFDEIYCAGGLYGNPFALFEILNFIGDAKCVFNGDYHWFDADKFWFSKNERNLQNQILLNGNVELELCNENSISCGCNYPEFVSDDTKIWANQIHQILKSEVNEILPPNLINRPTTFSLKVGNLSLAITHGDEKTLSGWGFSAQNLAKKSRQSEIYNWLAKNSFDAIFSTHTCTKVFADLNDKIVLNNGAAGLSTVGTNGVILRTGIKPKSKTIFSKKIKNTFLEAHLVKYDNAKFIKWFDEIWGINSPASKSYRDRILKG